MRGSIETRYNANNTARGILFTPFILSLSLSLCFLFFPFASSFLYLVVRTSQSRTSVSRDTLLCVT